MLYHVVLWLAVFSVVLFGVIFFRIQSMFNWSGFYIGGNGGWGRSDDCWSFFTLTGAFLDHGCHNRSGGIIGGQIGYRWQLPNNHFVLGLEAQGDWANIRESHLSLTGPNTTFGSKLDGIGLFTGQFGFAWDTWLLYAKGGAAVTSNTFSVGSTVLGDLASVSSTRWGGTLGVGFEYGLTPNWSLGLEYDHLFMGASEISFPVTVGTFNRITQDVDMVTVRANYRFGGFGGPVVARY